MFRNYLKIAFRNLKRRKLIASINIIGLSLGVAVSLLLGVYAHGIMTYDMFHENADDLYYMYRTRATPEGGQIDVPDTWAPLVEVVKSEFPGVIDGGRLAGSGALLTYNGQEFNEGALFSDQGMIDIFSYPLAKGDKATVFKEPNSIILSQDAATRIFGDEDPLGKTVQLRFGSQIPYTVTGVFGEIPYNSSFNFNMLINLESRRQSWVEQGFFEWRGSFMLSFLQLRPDQDPEALKDRFAQLVEKYVPEQEQGTIELMPLKDYYNFNTGQQQYGYILFYIAIGILLIAVINFTNLSAAQSLERFKEVGVRKVFGAGRQNLVSQFISEAVITCTLSFLLGIGMAFLLLPQFVSLFQQQISLDFILELQNIPLTLLLILLTGALSGLYPTFILSRLQPRAIFQDVISTGKRGFDPKSVLVVFQFSIAIMLIAAVGIMQQQIGFMKGANMNFEVDRLLVLNTNIGGSDEAVQRVSTLRNSLEALSGVESVSASNAAPGRYRGSYVLVQSDDARDQPPLDWRFVQVDHTYFSTMKIDFVEGRDFDANLATDQGFKGVINEAAMRQLGWENVEGRRLMFPNSDQGIEVIGVVKDFNYQSLANAVEPVIHLYRGTSSSFYNLLLVKLNSGDISATMEQVEAAWNDYDPNIAFSYNFLDQDFQRLYQTEERVASMISYAAVLAIIVAVLGILGLASFSVLQRMKEVAIRKVLGASMLQILNVLFRQFTIMMLISLVVAVPINYYLISDWLNGFAFRVDINVLIYLLAGVLVLVSSWLVLGSYAFKAVRANPADTLRHE